LACKFYWLVIKNILKIFYSQPPHNTPPKQLRWQFFYLVLHNCIKPYKSICFLTCLIFFIYTYTKCKWTSLWHLHLTWSVSPKPYMYMHNIDSNPVFKISKCFKNCWLLVAGPENSIIQGQLQHICLIINYFEINCQKNIIMQDSIFFLHKILFFENNI
jgi:hypothetical protein